MSAPAPVSAFSSTHLPTRKHCLLPLNIHFPEHPEQQPKEDLDIADNSEVDSGEDKGTDIDMDSISQKSMELDTMGDFPCSGSPEFCLGAGAPNQPTLDSLHFHLLNFVKY